MILDWGNVLVFHDEHEYYETLGLLCKDEELERKRKYKDNKMFFCLLCIVSIMMKATIVDSFGLMIVS